MRADIFYDVRVYYDSRNVFNRLRAYRRDSRGGGNPQTVIILSPLITPITSLFFYIYYTYDDRQMYSKRGHLLDFG